MSSTNKTQNIQLARLHHKSLEDKRTEAKERAETCAKRSIEERLAICAKRGNASGKEAMRLLALLASKGKKSATPKAV